MTSNAKSYNNRNDIPQHTARSFSAKYTVR
jgi:hypothetical protein